MGLMKACILFILLQITLAHTNSSECQILLLENKGSRVSCDYCKNNLLNCVYEKSLAFLDELLQEDVVEITNGVQLVRYKSGNQSDTRWYTTTLLENQTLGQSANLQTEILSRIYRFLSTHILKIYIPNQNTSVRDEARHRRRHQMMPMMLLFGMIAIGAVVIPMGFQFLAVLGGKALLLAKMALLLTAIQGLKKIATSPYNYGLYHAPTNPWYSDRKYLDEGPGINVDVPEAYQSVPEKSAGIFSVFSS